MEAQIFQSEPPPDPRCHKGDMQQVPYSEPTNIKGHCTKFCHPGDPVPRICAHWHILTYLLTYLLHGAESFLRS